MFRILNCYFTLVISYDVNRFWPGRNRHFADAVLKYMFMNDNHIIPPKFVSKGPIDTVGLAIGHVMDWRRKTTSHYMKPWRCNSRTLICVTQLHFVCNPFAWHQSTLFEPIYYFKDIRSYCHYIVGPPFDVRAGYIKREHDLCLVGLVCGELNVPCRILMWIIEGYYRS